MILTTYAVVRLTFRPTLLLDSVVVSTKYAVQIKNLVKSYGSKQVVRDLSLVARAGELTSVLGPNGAGKTTTIECCEGLRVPDSGTIRVLGLDPQTQGNQLRARVGVMLQDGGLPSSVAAKDVLAHVSKFYQNPWPLEELSERLGLNSFSKTQVRRLSGGQHQRLALAAAVVGRPELVFLDEPSAGMDPQSRHAVWDLINELKESGVSIVLTTHLMDEAEHLSDNVIVVDHGQVIAQGSPIELVAGDAPALVFATSGDLDAGGFAAFLASRFPGTTLSTIRPGKFRIIGAVDAELLAQTTRWCADQGLTITQLTLGKRTLEDLFLDLTGRSLR